MRKITLMLTLLTFSLLTFGQMPKADKAKSNAVYNVQHYKSVKSVKAAGDVYWSEDFDSTRWAASVNSENLAIPTNMPDGWTVYDATGNNFFWHWSQQGPRGKYCSNNPLGTLYPDANKLLHSTTYKNGVIMLESAYFNTDVNGDIVSSPIDMDSYIQTPAIDLSGAPGVTLKFEQRFRYCCSSSNSKLSVYVSVDYDPTNSDVENGHWAEYDTKAGVNANEYNPERQVEVDISDVAAGQETVYIRWRQTAASHYMWQIDDVQLVEPMSNNILIEKTWADYLQEPNDTASDYDATYDWNGGYTNIPLQLKGDFLSFRAAVKNFGLATQTGVNLNVKIDKDSINVYDQTSASADIEKAQRDTLVISTAFTPTEKGHYQIFYTVSQDQTDEFPSNNYDESYFNITDSVYSRTSHDPKNYISVSPQDWVGAADGDYLLNEYMIPQSAGNVTVSSVTTYIMANNDSATIADGNMSMIVRLYGVDGGDISTTPIVSSDLYTITFADTGSFVTIPFVKDGNEIIQPGEYWVAIETYTNYSDPDNKIRFNIGNDKTVPYTSVATYCHTDGRVIWTGDNAVIDLNIVPTTPQDVVFNVNMNYAIGRGDFDATNDFMDVAGTINNWGGSDHMTDADGDGIYTITYPQIATGETIEYKYRINGDWATSEFPDSGPNRQYIVVGGQNILNDIYDDDTTTVALNDDASLSDLQIDGTTISGFLFNKYSYDVILPYGTTQVPTVTATTTEGNANAVVTPAVSLPGTTIIVVTSGDGTTELTYSVNFTVASQNSDATLSDLRADGKTIEGFTPAVYDYNLELPYGTTQVPTVTATTNIENANAVVTQATSLPGTATIVVTAEDGSTQLSYSIDFTIEPNDDATLSDLKVSGSTISGFASYTLNYNIELPYGTIVVPNVTAITADNNASYVITPANSLPGTTNVIVTAEDGTTELTYSVNFTIAAPNDDATLGDLKIDGTTVSGFASDKYSYDIILPSGTTEIPTITATTSDKNANAVITPASGLPGTTNLVVTAEDGTTELTYSVNFTVASQNSDATLSDLRADGNTIEGFTPAVYDYNVELPYGTTEVPTVTATTNIENANAVVTQATSLPGTATIVVTAEDGTTIFTYSVNFTIALPNNDATLSDLKVNGTTVSEFSYNKYSYYIRLPYGTTQVPTVTAITTDENANAVITPASGLPGTTNVVVTAEDGTTELTYSVNFTIALPNNDATLSDLKVNGTTINGFTSDVFDYYDTLPSGTIQVPVVEAIANDVNATITIVPASEVTGTTTIVVFAEDKSTQLTYFVHFSVANTNIKTLNKNNIQLDVYPNPCNDKLNIVLTNNKQQDVEIRLVNIAGQVLYMKEIRNAKSFTDNINVSQFAKGIYYLKINAGGVSKIKEVAISR